MINKVDVHIEKVEPHSDIVVVRINGSLDTVAAYTFHEKMDRLIERGVYKFIINLEKLDYISSAGIGVFPGVALDLQKHHGGLVFINVSKKIYKLFEMIGLTTIFSIKETKEEAIKEFVFDE
jgi:anti-sigma B factor antagonist